MLEPLVCGRTAAVFSNPPLGWNLDYSFEWLLGCADFLFALPTEWTLDFSFCIATGRVDCLFSLPLGLSDAHCQPASKQTVQLFTLGEQLNFYIAQVSEDTTCTAFYSHCHQAKQRPATWGYFTGSCFTTFGGPTRVKVQLQQTVLFGL